MVLVLKRLRRLPGKMLAMKARVLTLFILPGTLANSEHPDEKCGILFGSALLVKAKCVSGNGSENFR